MTQPAGAARAHPFFLGSGPERRFCLFHAPAGTECKGALLYLHPFGDEMNKARRMAALQARALAALGYGVLQLDLHGCGDSAGDFADARWDGWKADVAAGIAWLQQRLGQPVGLWGLRVGALLALDYARSAPQPLAQLLLWQPVQSGASFLTQFLRMRMAKEMMNDDKGAGGGTAAMRASLQAGAPLEVGGYELAPQMAAALDGLDAAAMAVTNCPVHWLEVVPAEGRPMPVAAARAAARWREQGVDLHTAQVACLPFWSTQEISECPALLAATTAILEGVPA